MADKKVGYRIHDSEELIRLFSKSPYQGQAPEDARAIFLGIDANYSEEISGHPFFERIVEYHEDGVGFWKRHGRHHPFLLDNYPFKRNTGGVPYHRAFSAMKLTSEYAPYISFVELLAVPTIGTSSNQEKTFWKLFELNPDHAGWLDKVLNDGSKRVVFLSDKVIRRMRKIKKNRGVFSWIPEGDAHGLLCKLGNTEIHKVFHFSDGRVHKQLPEMKILIDSVCRDFS